MGQDGRFNEAGGKRASPVYSGALKFRLNSFGRLAWVGEDARAVWEPRLAEVRRTIATAEWLGVKAGARDVALMVVPVQEVQGFIREWRMCELAWARLDAPKSRRRPYWIGNYGVALGETVSIVVSRASVLNDFLLAWRGSDHDRIAGLLGYPECCRDLLRHVSVSQRLIDTMWTMANNGGQEVTVAREVQVRGRPETNVLLAPIGIRAVPHWPCSFQCHETARVAQELRAAAVSFKSQSEAKEAYSWLDAVLRWPAEWSALHGIAEVKSPILQMCMATDATAGKYTVRWLGDDYPEEGASGLQFPYRRKSCSPPRLVTLLGGAGGG